MQETYRLRLPKSIKFVFTMIVEILIVLFLSLFAVVLKYNYSFIPTVSFIFFISVVIYFKTILFPVHYDRYSVNITGDGVFVKNSIDIVLT